MSYKHSLSRCLLVPVILLASAFICLYKANEYRGYALNFAEAHKISKPSLLSPWFLEGDLHEIGNDPEELMRYIAAGDAIGRYMYFAITFLFLAIWVLVRNLLENRRIAWIEQDIRDSQKT